MLYPISVARRFQLAISSYRNFGVNFGSVNVDPIVTVNASPARLRPPLILRSAGELKLGVLKQLTTPTFTIACCSCYLDLPITLQY